MEKNGWNDSQIRKYKIPPLQSVPKLAFDDPKVMELIAKNRPVIITGSDLTASCSNWDLDYLQAHMQETSCTVIFSRNHKFKFFDIKSVTPDVKAKFVPPTREENLTMKEFADKLKDWKKGEERIYLQQILNSTVGPSIVQDFVKINWKWIGNIQKAMNWGALTTNLLLISQEGNVTPCHYDEQQNLFAQIRGYKRFIMYPPDQFECLYPYPVFHPHDRQSQVDLDKIDLERFPKFLEADGYEAIVGPGEILYLPIYWWHQVESLMRGGYTVSINFWYKGGPTGDISYPLRGDQKVAIMRNIEKMLVKALQDPEEVGPLLCAMVLGRYHSHK